MSSCFSASYRRRVCVTGQTRISSSFGSTWAPLASVGRVSAGRGGVSGADSGGFVSAISVHPVRLLTFADAAAHGKQRGEHAPALGGVGRFEQSLLFDRRERAHRGQEHDEVGGAGALDRLPVGGEIVAREI